jgi:sugar lactone lactonase YvrE
MHSCFSTLLLSPARYHERSASRLPRRFVLAALCLAAGASSLPAQTGVSGATIPVGSGFSHPSQVAVDGRGDIFVADFLNSAIKEIVAGTNGNAAGIVSSTSTVNTVGSGFSGPYGVAVDGKGNVFVGDDGSDTVYEIVAGTNGNAAGIVSSTSTVKMITARGQIVGPGNVAVDGRGDVFVTSANGDTPVYELVAGTNGNPPGIVSPTSQVVPVGSSFAAPFGVAVDSHGDVFVADNYADAAYEIVAGTNGNPAGVVSSTSTVNTVGSGFASLLGIAVDGSGNVFVGDNGNGVVQEIVAGTNGNATGIVSSTSQVVSIGSGFSGPDGVAVDGSGNVFVGDFGASAVYEIVAGAQKFPDTAVKKPSLPLTTYFTFTSGGTLAATPYVVLTQGAKGKDFRASASQLANACVGGHAYEAGDVCTVNVTFTPAEPYQRIGAVQLMGSSGMPIATFNLRGNGLGPQVIFPSNSTVAAVGSGLSNPAGVAVDGSGDVFVGKLPGSGGIYEIVAVDGAVSSSSAVKSVGSGFLRPVGVAVDGSGDVFVADSGNSEIKEIVAVNGTVSSGSAVKSVGSGFSDSQGVAVDGSGDVFVGDSGNVAVKEIVAVNGAVSSTSVVNTVGSGFSSPDGVAVDASGDVFVADIGASLVYEIVAVNGVVSSSSVVKAVGSGFSEPFGVAVDGSGDVFVADEDNTALYEIVAGTNGNAPGAVSSSSQVVPFPLGSGYMGLGVPVPQGVAVDGSGNVFTVLFDYAVLEIDRADPPTLSFVSTLVGSTSSDSPQSVLFENAGNKTLSAFKPGLSIGANFEQVDGSGTPADCTADFSLAAGRECNLSLSFKPKSSGPISSKAVFTDNALNAPSSAPATQSLTLDGTGTPAGACSPPSPAGVHICIPVSGSTVSSPVKVEATAKVTGTISTLQLWVDGAKRYTVFSNTFSQSVSLAAGPHRFAMVAVNKAGKKWESAVNATVK